MENAQNQESQRFEAFEGPAVNGSGMAWGVKEEGSILYDPLFAKATSVRLAQLCETHGDNEWATQSALLIAEQFDLTDPSEHAKRAFPLLGELAAKRPGGGAASPGGG